VARGFDNGRSGRVCAAPTNRQIKSLSDTLKASSRFRLETCSASALDYSDARSSSSAPSEKLHVRPDQEMALKCSSLHLPPSGSAGKLHHDHTSQEMVEQQDPVVWDILSKKLIANIGADSTALPRCIARIQASNGAGGGQRSDIHTIVALRSTPISTEDRWPCTIPFSPEAQVEASVLMLSPKTFVPGNGPALAVPSRDMVLGIYYMTKGKPGPQGRGPRVWLTEEVVLALRVPGSRTAHPDSSPVRRRSD